MSSFRDLVKKVNEQKKASSAYTQDQRTDGEEEKHSSFRDLVKKVNDGTFKAATTMSATDVEAWYKGVNNTSKSAYSYLTQKGYKKPNADLQKSIDSYLSKADYVGQYLRANKNSISNYEELWQSHSDAVNYLRQLQDGLKSSDSYYSRWKNEEDYLNAIATEQWNSLVKQKEEELAYWEQKKQDILQNPEVYQSTIAPYVGRGEVDADGNEVKHSEAYMKMVDGEWENMYSVLTAPYDEKITALRTELAELDPETRGKFEFLKVPEVLKDGIEWYDIPAVVAGTAVDAAVGLVKGAGNVVEGLVDLGGYGAAALSDWAGADGAADAIRGFSKKNLVETAFSDTDKFLDQASALGRTSDSVAEGLGQMGLIMATGGLGSVAGLGTVGTTVLTSATMGLSSMGSGMSEAYQHGASDMDAFTYGLIAGTADAATELLFGGLGKGMNALGYSQGLVGIDDMLATKVSNLFTSQISKNLVQFGIKASAEGLEEVLAGIAQAWGKSVTYLSEEDFNKILADENLLEQFIVGMVTSAFAQMPGLRTANKNGVDFIQEERNPFTQYGNAILNADGGVDFLKALADDVAGVSDSKTAKAITKQAGRVSGEVATGKGLGKVVASAKNTSNAAKIGRLYETVSKANNQNNTSKNQADIARSLERKGFSTEEAGNIAETLVASYNGENLTKGQRNLLKSVEDNKDVQQTIRSIVYNEQSTMGQRSRKIRNFDDQIITAEYIRLLKAAQQPQETAETAGVQVAAETQNEAQSVRQEASGINISEDGVTRQVSTGEAITPVKIASISEDGFTVTTKTGTEISSDDISFESTAIDQLWRTVSGLKNITPESANMIINGKSLSNISTEEYISTAHGLYMSGYHNLPISGKYSGKLRSELETMIYNAGKKAAGAAVAKQQSSVKAAEGAKVRKTGSVHYGYEGGTMEDRQKTGKKLSGKQSVAVDFAQRLAKSRGITFYFYESYVDENGNRVYKDRNGEIVKAENGSYDSKDGSIHIDLNAGSYGRGSVLFTVAHELTHFIQDWSPKHYKQLCNILMKGYAAKGQSVEELVANQQAFAKEHGRELTWDEAYDEVIADSMESILADGKVMELMRDIEAADKTLGDKVKKFFRDICDLLKRTIQAYSHVKPDSEEGRMVQGMQDIYDQLQQLFAEGLYEGGDNYRKAEKNTTAEGGVKMMSREEGNRIKGQIFAASSELNQMDVVVSVTTAGFAGMQKSDIAKTIDAEFSKFGNRVDRQNFGIILLEFQQINKALNYLNTDGEKAALLTVPRVLKRGIMVDSHTEHKERNVDSFTIAAPVKINGKRGNVGVVVQRVTGTNRFKTLRILLPNGKAFEFAQNKEADPTTGSSSKPKSSEGIPIEPASKNSIRNESGIVKKNESAKSDKVKMSARKGETAEKALSHFGRTFSWKETGYLLTDGAKLDFSGRHEGASGGYRSVDHRDILDAYPEDTEFDGNGAMVDFMSQGNIRIMPEGNGINLQIQPTKAQEQALSNFISRARGEVTLDIDDANGNTVVSVEYPKGTYYSKVLQDIRNYFVDGTEPTVSPMAQFRFSARKGEKLDNRMTEADIKAVQNIGRKSLNAFSAADIKATERFANQYWKEMGVKSPFFRAWFGDWRANDQTPVQVATKRGDTRGVQKNTDTGWDIQVSGQVFNETKVHQSVANREARPYLPYINDIVKKAILLDSYGLGIGDAKSANSLLMHSMYAVADIGNGPEILKLYVEEMNDPNQDNTAKRAYQLQNIEKAFNASVRVQGQAPSSLTNASNAMHTVADLFASVKQKDASFQPNPASKVVNADRAPKVMHHGSPAQFTIFDKKKAKSSGAYGSGFYFTDSQSHAATYGQQYSVYLNIRNPLQYGNSTVSRAQVRQFLEAVAENEDYSIENYGTYDVDSIVQNIMGKESKVDAFKAIQDISATAIGNMVEAVELFNQVNGTKYDGIITATETVAFYPEQIKSATDNIGTFDGGNPDIRFSARKGENDAAQAVLEQENAQLKENITHLKELLKLQRTVTNGTKFTKTSVEAAARMLKKNANAKGDTAELANLLNSFYEHIATYKELTWESVKENAQPVVDWLQDHVNIKPQRSEYAQDILSQLHGSRIYLDDTQKAEAAHRYGSFETYRKSMMGTVIISKDAGFSLDSLWHEFSAMYPDIFDSEITAADQPLALSDVVYRLRNSDTSMLEYEYNREFIAMDLLQQVYDSYWRVSAMRTFADANQAKINRLRGEHYQRMSKLREDNQARIQQLKDEHRTRLDRVRKEYRAQAEKKQKEITERYQEARKKAMENREKTSVRHKIQRVVGELNDLLLHEDKKHHVPDSLKKAVADALSLVNMDNVGVEKRITQINQKLDELERRKADAERTGDLDELRLVQMEIDEQISLKDRYTKMGGRLEKLATAYEEIKNSDDPDVANGYDPVISASLNELAESIGNTSLRDMSIDQLHDVYDMYKMVLTRVRDANKSLIDSIKETITNRASRVVGEVRRVGGEHKVRASALDPVRAFSWNNLKPVYAMERIGSATMTEAYNNVRKGEDTWAQDVVAARAYFIDKSKKYGYDSWDFEKKYHFKSVSEQEFDLTLEQILSLYAYSKRDQAGDHLKLGGFVFDSNIETYKEKGSKLVKYKVNTADAHQISPEILAQITGTLTKEQQSFVDEMQDYLSTVMGAKGNEVTMKMYGVKLFKEKFYFPLKSARQFMFEQNEVAGEVRIKNSGFTNKTKPKANNPVILNNFMDVWANHVNDMSMYHSFVLPLEDFNRIFNYNSPKKEGQPPVSVKGTIQNAYSPAAVSYLKQLITDLNGGVMADPRETVAKSLLSKFKKAKVFSSMSVVIQQPSAIGRAFAVISPKYFRPTKDGMNHEALWEELKQYAPVAVIKEMGYFDTNMGRSTLDFIKAREYTTFKEKAKAIFADSGYRDEKLSRLPALADEVAWCAIWNAVKRETIATHHDLSPKSEEFLKAAGERFTEVVTKTQVYDSVLARSANMRSKSGLMSMVTSFMAEPTTTINMLEDAILKSKRGDKGYAAKAFASVATSIILNNALVALVYGMRDDDEDETYAEKYAQSFVSGMLDDINPITYYPYLRDMWSLLQGYDVERSDMSLVSDLTDAVKGLVQAYTADDGDVTGAWWDLTGAVANIGGVPMQNIRRDVNGAINLVKTLTKDFNGRATTWGSFGDAIAESVRDTLPVVGWLPGDSKGDNLYDAIIKGDTAYMKRLEGSYKTEDAYHSAVRKALRENDSRIMEAAWAQINGDPSERVRIAKQIIADGFEQDDVDAAINTVISDMTPKSDSSSKKAKGFYTADDFAKEWANGDRASANAAKADIIATAKKNGKTQEEAEESFVSSAKAALKELYLNGGISESRAVAALKEYCEAEEDDIYWTLDRWKYEDDTGSTDGYGKYNDFHAAVQTGKNLKTVIKEYTDNGVESKTLASQITSHFKPLYREMTRTERAALKGYLLNAYVLLGYDRSKKSKDIDKWLED